MEVGLELLYIGSHTVKELAKSRETRVTIVDNFCGGDFDSISVLQKLFEVGKFEFVLLDLSEFKKLEELFRESHFDAIIHFAAHLQVGESVQNPLKYYRNNTMNTINLIDMALKYGVNYFIFSSSAAVYGEPIEIPISETHPKKPINPYGLSKWMSEQILQDATNSNPNFKYVALRYFNVAGASSDGSLGESHTPETHLIPLIAQSALGKRQSIVVFGDDYDTFDGSCIRDYIHIEDLALAHIKALEYLANNNPSDSFNCGYGHGYSVFEVIEMVKKISGVDFKVNIAPRRAGDPAQLVANNHKIVTQMGWKPYYDDLEKICKSAWEWEKL